MASRFALIKQIRNRERQINVDRYRYRVHNSDHSDNGAGSGFNKKPRSGTLSKHMVIHNKNLIHLYVMHLLECVPHIAVSVRKGGLDPVLKEQLHNCMETKKRRKSRHYSEGK
jgi:hypothetical protein